MTKRRAKGEGSLYFNESAQRWVAQITLPNGKRKSKTGKSQKSVRDWLIQERQNLKTGLFVEDKKVKLGAFLNRYMEDVAVHTLRPKTFRTHSDLIRLHINPDLGHIKLSSLRPDQVQALYSKKLRQGLSKRTVQYIHSVLHKCLKQAVKWGLATRNVTDLVEVPKPEKKTFKTWSVAELNTFIEAVEDHRWHPIYIIAIYCGLRQGEILGLHRKDVDLETGTIHVRHQITVVSGQGLMISQPKTEKSIRPITLPASALEVLKDYLKDFEGKGLIFTTRTGRPISPRNVLRHFKTVVAKTGLPEIRFHDLRHTHATLLLAAGVHPKIVQERLGHSQISLTLDTYSHVIPSLQNEASDKFESIMT